MLRVVTLLAVLFFCPLASLRAAPLELLNVSYDPTRELFDGVNERFKALWRERHGQELAIYQSHGGSGKQARSVMFGLEADVVTLALSLDIDRIARAGLLPLDWQKQLPHNSSPYTSTIVFVVRQGNPKGIREWGDLVKEGVQVITPNPKTSGGARWNYLAALGYARKTFGNEAEQRLYLTRLMRNVPVLDTGARGSTTTFLERGIGDVLLAWENEAHLAVKAAKKDKVEIVIPSISVLAEPPVAVVEENAKRHGTLEVARAYLEFLYTPEIQMMLADYHFRPSNPEVFARVKDRFPAMSLLSVDRDFGGWAKVQKEHFEEGGVFDQIYEAR